MSKPFDIVLWGATGFTGRLVAEYLARHADDRVHWAIGGRNQNKLETVRQSLTAVKPDLANLPILIGNSLDDASMQTIVSQTRVVCTTVGPYTKYGTPLVAACAAQGVDYCDLTGEVTWIRQNIDTFHAQAQKSGARIVHCCGVDSIPSDLGALMVQEYAWEKYGRFCQSIQHLFTAFNGGFSGGTVASLLLILEQAGKNKTLRKQLANPYSLVPERKHDWSETDQITARFDPDFQRWTGPFVMASINTRIVRYSHALQENRYGDQYRFREAMQFPKGLRRRLMAAGFSIGYGAGMGLMTVQPVRSIIQKYLLPGPGEGPSKEERDKGYFRSVLLGKIPQPHGAETWVKGKIAGTSDPGYGETAKMLGESALCLATDDLPERGGILTPAVAMGMTLVERLRHAGMTFSVEPW